MTIVERMGRALPDLWQTVARFPVPVLICLAGTVILNLDIADIYPMSPDRSQQVYDGLICGFLAAGAAHLYAESRDWSRLSGSALAVLAAAILGGVCWFFRPLDLQFEFLLPGLVLLVMVAGYTRGDNDDNAIWMFNARLALAIILSGLVVMVFGGGLSAIVASIEYLFGVDFDPDIYPHIWATGFALIGAVYGLSMVSQNLSEPFRPDRQSGLLVTGPLLLLNYLLVPLALIYVVILHLYAVKMLIDWELPKGQVGIMVLIFSLGGAAIWLIALPWRAGGSALVRFFNKNWFLFLIVPLGLLAIGTWRRISDYGVTPERYGLVALGLWVAFLIVWFVIRSRSIQPRIVLGSLGILLIATSLGPWGAGSVSIDSQLSRLTALMQAEGYFQDGKLVIPDTIDAEASGDGYSIVLFLSKHRRLELLAPIFAGHANDPFDGADRHASASDVNSVLKFRHYRRNDRPVDKTLVYFRSTGRITLDVPQATVLSGVVELGMPPAIADDPSYPDPTLYVADGIFTVRYGQDQWEMEVEKLLETVQAASRVDGDYPPLVVSIAGRDGVARLAVLEAGGRLESNKPVLNYVRALLVLPAP